ncbi:LysR family transcriptional regulator [Chenggangzhangella methanolivorans]
MTLEQLRIFVAVAEREHVTKAAQDLNLTQSAVSAAVSTLEARYATKLFDRVGRSIVLTEAGRMFLGEARSVLARASTAEQALTDLSGLKRGRLALAASQTVAGYWLSPLIHDFRRAYPGVEVSLQIANTDDAAALIRNGEADVGIVEGEIDDPLLASETVAEDDMVLVVAPGHPWIGSAPSSGEDLIASEWTLREPGSGTRAIFEAAIETAGVSMEKFDVMVLASNEAVRSAVEAGAGATVLSRLVAKFSIATGALVVVPFQLPTRRFLSLRHRERHVTKATQAFLDMLQDGKT